MSQVVVAAPAIPGVPAVTLPVTVPVVSLPSIFNTLDAPAITPTAACQTLSVAVLVMLPVLPSICHVLAPAPRIILVAAGICRINPHNPTPALRLATALNDTMPLGVALGAAQL